MIVAAGAGDGQPEKRLAEDVEHVVEPVALVLANIDRRMDPLAQEPEARADDRLVEALAPDAVRGCVQQIARDVLDDELVVGHIGVERADDVVAILKRVGDVVIELMPARLGVAHQVEPMPAPAFAEVGRGEQLVDQFFDGRFV